MYTTPADSANQSIHSEQPYHFYESIDDDNVAVISGTNSVDGTHYYQNEQIRDPAGYENSSFRPDSTAGEYEFTPGGYEELNRVQYQNTRDFLERFYEQLQNTQ